VEATSRRTLSSSILDLRRPGLRDSLGSVAPAIRSGHALFKRFWDAVAAKPSGQPSEFGWVLNPTIEAPTVP